MILNGLYWGILRASGLVLTQAEVEEEFYKIIFASYSEIEYVNLSRMVDNIT